MARPESPDTAAVAARLARAGSAAVSDALDEIGVRGVGVGLRSLCGPRRALAGPVMTWKYVPVAEERPGVDPAALRLADDLTHHVLVVDTTRVRDVASVGLDLARLAVAHRLAGMVTDGACRQVDEMAALDLPVYGRSVVPLGSRGRLVHAAVGEPVIIGDLLIDVHDWVVGDATGVVFVPGWRLPALLRRLGDPPREAGPGRDLSAGAGLDPSLLSQAGLLGAATLHEAAGRTGALPARLRPLDPDLPLAGTALPVQSPPGDNLWLHRAVYAADPGDVLVVDTGGGRDFGYWGEVLTVAARQRGIAGLVVNGGIRDGAQIRDLRFPAFHAGRCIRGTAKDPAGAGSIGTPVTLAGTVVRRGDLVVGDGDGVVVVPRERAVDVVAAGVERQRAEADYLRRLRTGETTLDIYRLPAGGTA